MASVADIEPQSSVDGGRSVADSLVVGIAIFAGLNVLQRLVGFGRSLAFCHFMTDAELGRWSLCFSFLLTAAPLAVLGLPGSFGRYFEHYRQRGLAHGFLRRTLSLTAVLATGFVAAVFLFPSAVSRLLLGTPEHAQLVRGLSVALALVIVMNVVTELATAMRQVRLVSVIQFLQSLLFATVACGLLVTTSLGDQGVVVGYGVASALALCVASVAIYRIVRRLPADSGTFDRSLWRQLLPFAAWLWVVDSLFNLFDTADRLMIVHFASGVASTDALVGQYHASRVVPTLLIAISTMLAGLVVPYLSDDWERGQKEKASATTALTVKLCSLVYVLGGAALLFFSPILFGTLLQGRYDAGLEVLPMTLLYCVWFGLSVLTQTQLLVAERAKWSGVAVFFGLIANILLNAALLPILGLTGAVAATATANATVLVLSTLFARSCGLAVNRGHWILLLLPAVLLAGWQIASVVWIAVVLCSTRTNLIFTADQKKIIASGWERFAVRLKLGVR